jgi:hypothetical protein
MKETPCLKPLCGWNVTSVEGWECTMKQPVVTACDLEKLRRDILQLRQTLAIQETKIAAQPHSRSGQKSRQSNTVKEASAKSS